MDANQASVVEDLRLIPGCTVLVLSAVGQGCPDILVGFRGFNFLFELKDDAKPPSRQRLTSEQQAFFASWTGQVRRVTSYMEILNFMIGHYEEHGPFA